MQLWPSNLDKSTSGLRYMCFFMYKKYKTTFKSRRVPADDIPFLADDHRCAPHQIRE